MVGDSKGGADDGVARVAGKAIDKLTHQYLIFGVVGLVAAGLALTAGVTRDSTVAIVVAGALLLAILVLGAIVYLSGSATETDPTSRLPAEFTDAVGYANEFADWCDLEVRPFPHPDEQRNHDARYYFGERMARLSESLGRLPVVVDDRVAALGQRVLSSFERVDPRLEELTPVERDIALQQVRADVNALGHAYSDRSG